MKRREFITLLGGAAAAWPLAARAQQAAMPVIGFLSGGSHEASSQVIRMLKQSLAEVGFDERNVAFEYRYAEGKYDRLAVIAAELVRRPVSLIVASTTPPALAAKAATSAIPIVFGATDDPVRVGLVASLARPGGNATGVFFFLSDLGPKRLGLVRELVPNAVRIGLLNPNHENAEAVRRDVTAAGSDIGATIDPVYAGDNTSLESAFVTLARNGAHALVLATDPSFFSRRSQLATLAAKHAIPAIYNTREFAEVGGLMSYGTSLSEMYQQLGVYTGRILKGEKPSDLPVVQSIKFELVINLKTAKTLGLDIPPTLLARADEVIE